MILNRFVSKVHDSCGAPLGSRSDLVERRADHILGACFGRSGSTKSRRLKRCRYLAALLLWSFTLIAGGCVEREASLSLQITEVSPELLQPGGRVVIKGRGFGEGMGSVAISARALTIEQWSAHKIIAQIPADTPRGERFLVVTSLGQQTPPFAVSVAGELEPRPRGGRPDLGVLPDMDTPDGAQSDMRVDMMEPDQTTGEIISITLDDPEAEVTLEAELRNFQGVEEIWLNVIARDPSALGRPSSWVENPLWGAAAQLDFPSDRLRFVRMDLPDGPDAAALSGEREGRIYWYHGNLNVPEGATRFTLMTLRFERLSAQDAAPLRFDFVPRHVSLRGIKNQRLSGSWSAGVLTFGPQGGTP